jgi:aminopeptidase-like protein
MAAVSGTPTRMRALFERLWPINRSIAGPGLRETLDVLAEIVPTQRITRPSGSEVFDWTVPEEWEVHEAYLLDPEGRRRADVAEHNLHLVAHSAPFRGRMSLEELRPHLFSLPDQPDAIPYVASFYRRDWGFCMRHRELLELPEGEYEVVVDTELRPGRVEVGEAVLEGESSDEVLFSTYVCHPMLASNELSGPLVLAFLYERLRALEHRRLTYRFVLGAETIGTLCYLHERGEHLREHLVAGYVLTCLGDPGPFTLKTSRRGDTLADRAAAVVLHGRPHTIVGFDPGNGSDERQYCSPGFDLPVASVMRTMYSLYPEYHTSLDDESYISFEAMAEGVEIYAAIVRALEANCTWVSQAPYGEPQLGKRGLYPGTSTKAPLSVKPTMWVVNLADGRHDLLAMAERSGQPIDELAEAAQKLAAAGLLKPGG